MTNFLSRFSRQLYRRWLYALMACLMALGVVISTPQPAPAIPWLDLLFRGIQVIQLSSISDEEEVELGQQINEQLVSKEFKLYTDRTVTQYIDEIGQRLAPESDRPEIPYRFQVVDDSKINAFATMGGYVYVTTGLVKTADNEAQLASVLSHEIGHIAERHAVNQMRERAVTAGILTAAGLDRSAAVNIGVELAVSRPNGRGDEYEADEVGVSTLQRAGYAPSAAVAFLQKLLNQSSVPTFLSTHPATDDRIERLNSLIDPATANTGGGLDSAAYKAKIKGIS